MSKESDRHLPDPDPSDDFDVRDGDVLVVSYPEIAVPIAQYFTVRVGGLTYTRRLLEGDDAQEQHDKIYEFLRTNAEREARRKVKEWAEEAAKLRVR